MQLKLTLKNHCIKCAAQKVHDQLINQYFKAFKNKKNLAEMDLQIEHIKYFLERADFDYLRFMHPELSGLKEAEVILELSENAENIKIISNGTSISPKWKDMFCLSNPKS